MSWLPWCCWTFYLVSWLFGLWALALMLRWCLVERGPPSTLGILSWQGSHQLTGSPSAPVLSEFGVLRAAWVSGLRVACVPRQLYVEAGALTNGCFDGFDLNLGVALGFEQTMWLVLGVLQGAGGGWVGELPCLRLK